MDYKNHLKLFQKAKRKAKITYYKNTFEENKYNTKETWKVLKQAIGKVNNKTNFPQSFNLNNKVVTNKSEIAGAFNKYWTDHWS